ncbi:hypothetical protein Tco_0323565 [Tanacetum coccineum]
MSHRAADAERLLHRLDWFVKDGCGGEDLEQKQKAPIMQRAPDNHQAVVEEEVVWGKRCREPCGIGLRVEISITGVVINGTDKYPKECRTAHRLDLRFVLSFLVRLHGDMHYKETDQ